MARYIIIAAYNTNTIKSVITPEPDDIIICADGGYELARKEGIRPNIVIGDFDSMPKQELDCEKVIQVPVEKDDTDTKLCLEHAISLGAKEVLIVGGLNGRMDHTYANIQLLAWACKHGIQLTIAEKSNCILLLENGSITIPRKEGYKLSLFSYSKRCEGVTISGVHYPLKQATLVNSEPIGVSNEFEADAATISVTNGQLLIMLSCDAKDD